MSISQTIRAQMRTQLKKVGLDVRFTSSENVHKAELAKQHAISQWKFLSALQAKTVLDIEANTGQFAEIVPMMPTHTHISHPSTLK